MCLDSVFYDRRCTPATYLDAYGTVPGEMSWLGHFHQVDERKSAVTVAAIQVLY